MLPGNVEGRIIVLLFFGVCALIALHQLFPALKRLFKTPEGMASRTEEAKKGPGDRG